MRFLVDSSAAIADGVASTCTALRQALRSRAAKAAKAAGAGAGGTSARPALSVRVFSTEHHLMRLADLEVFPHCDRPPPHAPPSPPPSLLLTRSLFGACQALTPRQSPLSSLRDAALSAELSWEFVGDPFASSTDRGLRRLVS